MIRPPRSEVIRMVAPANVVDSTVAAMPASRIRMCRMHFPPRDRTRHILGKTEEFVAVRAFSRYVSGKNRVPSMEPVRRVAGRHIIPKIRVMRGEPCCLQNEGRRGDPAP